MPFLVWVVGGGICIALFSRRELFEFVNSRNTPTTDTMFAYVTWMGQAEVIIPVLLALMIFKPFRRWYYFLLALVTNNIPFFIQQGLKMYFEAPRPMNYFKLAKWIHYIPEWPFLMLNSFPSGHSQGSFSFFCFLSLLLPKRHAKWGLAFFVLALSVCYSRIYLAAHFFEDVYAGSILGTLLTTLLFSLMEHYVSRPLTDASPIPLASTIV